MSLVTIGLDLAKYVFQVHGVDESGRVVLRKQLRRVAVEAFFAVQPPCLVGTRPPSRPDTGAPMCQIYGVLVSFLLAIETITLVNFPEALR